jgi:tetratricopeptide (TPR) repeat protein
VPAAHVSPPAALPSKPNTATATSTTQNDSNAPKAEGIPDFARQLADCRAQFLKNRLRDAGITCAAALQSNPRSADALTLMAHVELNRGRLGRANDLAQKAIALDGKQADAYVIIGGVHQDSGRTAQAKAAYFRYLELAPHGRYADELRSIVGSL